MRRLCCAAAMLILLASPAPAFASMATPEQMPVPDAKSDLVAIYSNIEQHGTELDMLAKLIYTEARGVKSQTEQAAIVWCVLNRVDSKLFAGTIAGVIRQKDQFAWDEDAPVLKQYRDLAQDVLMRYEMEKMGYQDVGRVLPKQYLYFAGHGGRNYFRARFRSGGRWNWELPTPYRK